MTQSIEPDVNARCALLLMLVCLTTANSAAGQWMGKQTGCYADSIVANPNRPTVSNPAHENQQLALAFSRTIQGGLQFVGEFYGQTQVNQTTPGFTSSLWALTYAVIPRLVIDGGFEVGLTPGKPQTGIIFVLQRTSPVFSDSGL